MAALPPAESAEHGSRLESVAGTVFWGSPKVGEDLGAS
jgi:hypothetical protein